MSAPEVTNRAARRHPRGGHEPSLASTPIGKLHIRDAAQKTVAGLVKGDPDEATLRLLRRELDRAMDRAIARRAARRSRGRVRGPDA